MAAGGQTSIKDDIQKYFKDVGFVVEATFEEQHLLWLTRHNFDLNLGHVEKWESEGIGRSPTVGYVGRGKKARPVVISIFYANLDGLRVAFWSPTSQLVDYALIGEWLNPRIDHIKDSQGNYAQTDTTNFHEVIHEIERRKG